MLPSTGLYRRGMHEDVIERMRERIKRTRRIIELAHDREMIAMLSEMVGEAEADLKRLEAERDQDQIVQKAALPRQN